MEKILCLRSYVLALALAGVLLAGTGSRRCDAAIPKGEAIAVLPFDSLSAYSSHDWMRTAFSEVLAAKLTGTSHLRVLDGKAVADALRGDEISLPTRTSTDAALEAGRAVEADLIIRGEIDKHATDISLHLYLTRVSDGKGLGEVVARGAYDEPWPVLTDAAQQSLKVLDRVAGPLQEARIKAQAARDRYSLTVFGRGLNDLYGVGGPVDLAGAEDNLKRALRIDPGNGLMYYALGVTQLAQGQPRDAGAAFYEALKAWPDYPAAHRVMATLSEQDEHADEAIAHLQAVLSVEPSDMVSHYHLGRLLASIQRVRPALDEMNTVTEGTTTAALLIPALKLQAQLRATAGDLPGMAESFKRLLKVEPHSRDALLGLGGYHLRRGALADAEAQYKALAKQYPNDPLPVHFLGEIALMKGDTDAAINVFRQEGGTRPSNPSAWSYLGETYRRANRVNKVVDAEGMAQVRAPTNPVPLNNLAVARYREGDLVTAAALLRQAISLSWGWALLHQNLGIVLAAQGKRTQALAAVGTAVELNPQLPAAQYQFGLLLAQTGDLAGAKEAFQAAIAASPNLAAAHYNLAGVLEALGDRKAAVKALETYLELSPTGGDVEPVKGRIARLK